MTAVDVQHDNVPPVFTRAFGVASIGALLELVASVFERVAGVWRFAHDDVCAAALRWASSVPAAMVPTEQALAYYGGALHVTGAAGLLHSVVVGLGGARNLLFFILC